MLIRSWLGYGLHSWWGSLASSRWKYATFAAKKSDVQTRRFDHVRRGVGILAANVPKHLMKLVLRGTMHRWEQTVGLWPAESTVWLDDQVNSRFTTLSERRGPLCGWTTQGVHKLIDVFIDDKFHSGAGRPKTFYDTTVETLYLTQYSSSAPGASKATPLWVCITLW